MRPLPVRDDSPDSPPPDDSLSTQLRTASVGMWVALALWVVIALYEFLGGQIVYGILFIFVGFLHAYTTLRTETSPDGESLTTEEGLTPLFWSRLAFLVGLIVMCSTCWFTTDHRRTHRLFRLQTEVRSMLAVLLMFAGCNGLVSPPPVRRVHVRSRQFRGRSCQGSVCPWGRARV
jgi:hypothetical protein